MFICKLERSFLWHFVVVVVISSLGLAVISAVVLQSVCSLFHLQIKRLIIISSPRDTVEQTIRPRRE